MADSTIKRMKTLALSLTVVAGLLVLNACQSSTPKAQPPAEQDPNLNASMQNLKLQMDLLLPTLLNAREFRAPENQASIAARLRTLERVSNNVTHSTAIKDENATLAFLSKGFHDDIRRSREAFEQGKKDYARTSLLNTGAYCIECHTRTNSGPSFQTNEFQQSLTLLQPLDRAEYLVATRQFDAALKDLDQVLKGGIKEGVTVFDLEKAAHMALQITVRFQNDPAKGLAIIDDILQAPNVPFNMKTNAQLWKAGLQNWKKEKKREVRDPLKKSRELVDHALKKQKGRDDRASDVEMMRVQSLLYPVLNTEKKPARAGEALYLMGQAYESVRDLSLSSLHEEYYEACIRKVPHSEWSKRCFKKFEESTLIGYSGSGGTSIPADVQGKLKELKDLAL